MAAPITVRAFYGNSTTKKTVKSKATDDYREERGSQFWLPVQHQLRTLQTENENKLYNNKALSTEKCSHVDILNGELEKKVGCSTYLAGPMVDEMLCEIGKAIWGRLTSASRTGLTKPIVMFIPLQIWSSLSVLFHGYGANIHNSKKNLTVTVDCQRTACKIFATVRFDGTYYLARRSNSRTVDDKLLPSTTTKVVVTSHTPMLFQYVYATKKLQLTFYVQRYDAKTGRSEDDTVQQLILDSEGNDEE